LKFSIRQIHHAAQNPIELDVAQAAAVEARIILDLRIGAAFTRMQTLALQSHFRKIKEQKGPVSYGPCQFPTLGFVVSQYKLVKAFVPESFWYIYLSLNRDGQNTEFIWNRGRVFEYNHAAELYENVLSDPIARVMRVTRKAIKKW
jgi:DNA topoisomerase-3